MRRPKIHLTPLYYLCRCCGQGLCPWDQTVGLNVRGVRVSVDRLRQVSFPAIGWGRL